MVYHINIGRACHQPLCFLLHYFDGSLFKSFAFMQALKRRGFVSVVIFSVEIAHEQTDLIVTEQQDRSAAKSAIQAKVLAVGIRHGDYQHDHCRKLRRPGKYPRLPSYCKT